MPVISVTDDGEFRLIARIIARLPGSGDVLLGPGDDAAVIAAPDGRVVATTDLLVEGRHFRREDSGGYDVGRTAAAANLADVVAMGARPTALLVGLAAPGRLELEWVEAFADGLREECDLVGASVAGGDVVGSDQLMISVTALGDLGGEAPITRSGARIGDVVVLLGRLGFAAAGLALLQTGERDHPMIGAHRRPQVDYAAGRRLRDAGATSLIDVSDGLLADLGHVAEASAARIEVRASDLPVPPELVEVGELLGIDPLTWVAGGGDDHAFAATMSAAAATSAGLTVIGVVSEGRPGSVLVGHAPPARSGHEHFRS